jgi:hypothetical protein
MLLSNLFINNIENSINKEIVDTNKELSLYNNIDVDKKLMGSSSVKKLNHRLIFFLETSVIFIQNV